MQAKSAFDLVFRNAITRGAPTPVDIGISGGKIAAIAPKLVCEAAEVDVAGRLVLPGFVDTHIHLDKACLLGRCGHGHGSLGDAIKAVAAMKRDFTVEDVYERGKKGDRACGGRRHHADAHPCRNRPAHRPAQL